MNEAIDLAILQVINDRKAEIFKDWQTESHSYLYENIGTIMARIDECDNLYSLITKKLNEASEARISEILNDIWIDEEYIIPGQSEDFRNFDTEKNV